MYDCDAVGLVPYLPHRWPREVVKLFPLVAWDRSTTVGAAFMATGQ
jgi:hypothetical protein